jgi:serine/threonine protein kinase
MAANDIGVPTRLPDDIPGDATMSYIPKGKGATQPSPSATRLPAGELTLTKWKVETQFSATALPHTDPFLAPPTQQRRSSTESMPPPRDDATLGPDAVPGIQLDGPVSGENVVPTTQERRTRSGMEVLPAEEEQPPAYRLLKIIGRGGMGEVWEATQTSLDRVVAVKRIRPEKDDDRTDPAKRAERRAAFRHEALIAARLEHPNVVPVHDLGIDEVGSPLLAMKLVNGQPWDKIIKVERSRMGREEFLARHLQILVDVSQAVAFAHSRGIVHRDLKPSQVMVGEFGEVLLMDWGIAMFVGTAPVNPEDTGPPEWLPTRQSASSPAGTPALMAPEQTLHTAERIGPWTDIYLLGGILYFLLLDAFPHDAPNSTAAMIKASRGEVTPPHQAAPDGLVIPLDLEALCMKALEKEPENRVPSATEFIKGLQDYLTGSSKRRESLATLAEAEARLKAGPDDYRTYSEVLGAISRAEALWSGNPSVGALRDRTYAAHARKALRMNDLAVARMQGERIIEPTLRSEVIGEVAAAEQRAESQRRTRRTALMASAALAGAFAVGAAVFAFAMLSQNSRLRRDNQRLEAQRRRGEELISFVLTDVGGRLSAIGRDSVLSISARATMEYLNASDDATDPALVRKRAEAYNATARPLIRRETLPAADDALLRALRSWDELLKATPDSADLVLGRAHTLAMMGEARLISGELGAAEQHLREALQATAAMTAPQGREEELTRLLASIRASLGTLLQRRGDMKGAVSLFEPALEAARRQLAASPSDSARLSLASSALEFALAALATGDRARGESALLEAYGAIEAPLAADPGNIAILRLRSRCAHELGGIALANARTAEAERYFAEEARCLVALAEALPDDESVATAALEAQLARAELRRTVSPGDAAAEYSRLIEAARSMLARNPRQPAWNFLLAKALRRRAAAPGSPDASGDFAAARNILASLESDAPDRAALLLERGLLAADMAADAAAGGRSVAADLAGAATKDLAAYLELAPGDTRAATLLAEARSSHAALLWRRGELSPALAELDAASQSAQAILDAGGTAADRAAAFAVLRRHAEYLASANLAVAAESAARRWFERREREGAPSPAAIADRESARIAMARATALQGRLDDALGIVDDALNALEGLAQQSGSDPAVAIAFAQALAFAAPLGAINGENTGATLLDRAERSLGTAGDGSAEVAATRAAIRASRARLAQIEGSHAEAVSLSEPMVAENAIATLRLIGADDSLHEAVVARALALQHLSRREDLRALRRAMEAEASPLAAETASGRLAMGTLLALSTLDPGAAPPERDAATLRAIPMLEPLTAAGACLPEALEALALCRLHVGRTEDARSLASRLPPAYTALPPVQALRGAD